MLDLQAMRTHRTVAVVAALLAVAVSGAVSGCGGGGGGRTTAQPSGSQQQDVVAPPLPVPVADGPCPYINEAAVERANGQRVGAVRISADRPHPACFFERRDGSLQLRTWIVEGTQAKAGATVDAVAPVASSDRAELPGGWSGGSQPTEDGAVFAVAKQGTAIVVTTNQEQTIKARRVAEQVIANLGL